MFVIITKVITLVLLIVISSITVTTITATNNNNTNNTNNKIENGIPTGASKELIETYLKVNREFDLLYPPQYSRKPLLSAHYHNRCVCQTPAIVANNYIQNKWNNSLNNINAIVVSSCLGTDSLGNMLSSYFDNLICAQLSGTHVLITAKMYEPEQKDQTNPFFDGFPSIIQHKNPLTRSESKRIIKNKCICNSGCHETMKSVWYTNTKLIADIVTVANTNHLNSLSIEQNYTEVLDNDLSNFPIGTKLPLIPEAAVHYRCGDNFVGHYGFLPFIGITNIIPSTVKELYVLAEVKSRKTSRKPTQVMICDAVFNNLFDYLVANYPKSKIVVKRGDNMFTDFARLSLAKYTVCSVSTFCLWPAIANRNNAYFPVTKLVLFGNSKIDLGFKWILNPAVVKGAEHRGPNVERLITLLGGKTANTVSKQSSSVISVSPGTVQPFRSPDKGHIHSRKPKQKPNQSQTYRTLNKVTAKI